MASLWNEGRARWKPKATTDKGIIKIRRYFSRMPTAHFPAGPGRGSLYGEIQVNRFEPVCGGIPVCSGPHVDRVSCGQGRGEAGLGVPT